ERTSGQSVQNDVLDPSRHFAPTFCCTAQHPSFDVVGCRLGSEGNLMRRRKFLTLVGGAAAALPLVARAQSFLPVVGFLNSASSDSYESELAAFRQGVKETGFV